MQYFKKKKNKCQFQNYLWKCNGNMSFTLVIWKVESLSKDRNWTNAYIAHYIMSNIPCKQPSTNGVLTLIKLQILFCCFISKSGMLILDTPN